MVPDGEGGDEPRQELALSFEQGLEASPIFRERALSSKIGTRLSVGDETNKSSAGDERLY